MRLRPSLGQGAAWMSVMQSCPTLARAVAPHRAAHAGPPPPHPRRGRGGRPSPAPCHTTAPWRSRRQGSPARRGIVHPADLRPDQQARQRGPRPRRPAPRAAGRPARTPNRSVSSRPGAAKPRATPWTKPGDTGSPLGRASPRLCRNTEDWLSNANSSPVIAVRNPVTRPAANCPHFECVPGRQTRPDRVGSACSSPEQLGLLPAHDVIAPGADGQARQDAHVEPLGGDRQRLPADRADVGGHIDIGRLPPALARAGHAAHDHRQRKRRPGQRGRHLVQMPAQDAFELVRLQPGHAFAGPPFRQHGPGGGKHPHAQAAGAPVGRDEGGRVVGKSHAMLLADARP